MRKLGYSLVLAAILVASLVFTVYSQRQSDAQSTVQVLSGGVAHEIPVDVTLVLSTTSGPQTVTVPVKLNLNLTVGPVDAIDLQVQADSPVQFVSPLAAPDPAATTPVTATDILTE